MIRRAKKQDFNDILNWANDRLFIVSKLEQFISLISDKDEINLNEVASLLNLKRTELMKQLLEWRKSIEFKIVGDTLKIDSHDMDGFLNLLDKAFTEWESEEKLKSKKI